MFGMGGSEILVILIVALLFLGPDKLPEAAKSISKGIRDIKKQSRVLQQTIEDDEHIGGAIRDLKSALRGEDIPVRPRPVKPKPQLPEGTTNSIAGATEPAAGEPGAPEHAAVSSTVSGDAADHASEAAAAVAAAEDANGTAEPPKVRLSATAGEMDPDQPDAVDAAELAALVKPAAGAIPRANPDDSPTAPASSEPKHG